MVGRKGTHCQMQFPDWESPSPPPGQRMHPDLPRGELAWEHGAETSGSHRVGEQTPASCVDMAAVCLRSIKGHAGLKLIAHLLIPIQISRIFHTSPSSTEDQFWS